MKIESWMSQAWAFFLPKEASMKLKQWSGALPLFGATLAFSSAGCAKVDKKEATGTQAKADGKKDLKHKHGAWWCQEHGIPEEICSLCSAEAAAKFKKE